MRNDRQTSQLIIIYRTKAIFFLLDIIYDSVSNLRVV